MAARSSPLAPPSRRHLGWPRHGPVPADCQPGQQRHARHRGGDHDEGGCRGGGWGGGWGVARDSGGTPRSAAVVGVHAMCMPIPLPPARPFATPPRPLPLLPPTHPLQALNQSFDPSSTITLQSSSSSLAASSWSSARWVGRGGRRVRLPPCSNAGRWHVTCRPLPCSPTSLCAAHAHQVSAPAPSQPPSPTPHPPRTHPPT